MLPPAYEASCLRRGSAGCSAASIIPQSFASLTSVLAFALTFALALFAGLVCRVQLRLLFWGDCLARATLIPVLVILLLPSLLVRLLVPKGDACLPSRGVFVELIGSGLLLPLPEELFEGHLLCLPEFEVVLDVAHKHVIECGVAEHV